MRIFFNVKNVTFWLFGMTLAASLTVTVFVDNVDCKSPRTDAQHDGKVVAPKDFKPRASSARSERGKELFQKNNCNTCHAIGATGGCLAPPLSGIAGRRSGKFIEYRISAGLEDEFATIYGGTQLMPHLRVSAHDAKLITEYLRTLPDPISGYKVVGHKKFKSSAAKPPVGKIDVAEPSVRRGAALLSEKGCLACHSVGNLGGQFAPKFDHIGSCKTKDAMKTQMQQAELLQLENSSEYGARGTTMPPLNLSAKDMEDIANYLSTLK